MATLDELANRISVLVQVLHLFSYHTVPEKE